MIVREGALDFDSMQMRLHPAESRINRLSAEIPAEYVVFDVLVWEGEPVWQRRSRSGAQELERVGTGFRLSPSTRTLADARGWLDRFESLGLDGVVAKRLGVPYLPGLARRRREGEGAQDRRLRRRRASAGRRRARTSRRSCSASTATTAALDYVGSCAVAAKSRADVAAQVLPLVEEDPELALRRAEPLG